MHNYCLKANRPSQRTSPGLSTGLKKTGPPLQRSGQDFYIKGYQIGLAVWVMVALISSQIRSLAVSKSTREVFNTM